MDEETEYAKRLDEVRLLVQTQNMEDIEGVITLRYGDQEYLIKIKEMKEEYRMILG